MGFGHASGVATAASTIILTIVSSMTVVSRVGTRVLIVHCFGIEDIFIIFSFIFAIILCIFTAIETLDGMGDHESELDHPYSWLNALYHTLWAYYLAMFCTKFSILIQYNRIFQQKKFRTATYLTMIFCIVLVTWQFFSAILTCIPIRKFWNPRVTYGGCLDFATLWFLNAGLNIFSDLVIIVLPLPVFNQLELPKKQKYGLMAVFGAGVFVCVISVLRLPGLYTATVRDDDRSWYYPGTAILSMAEVNLGIICSCLPTLRALVSRFWPSAFTTKELVSMTSNASEGQYTKVHSELGTSISKTSSDGVHVPNIASHALYVRNGDVDDRSQRSEEVLTVPVPSNLPENARVHVFTTVDQGSERPTSSGSGSRSRSGDTHRVRFNSGIDEIASFDRLGNQLSGTYAPMQPSYAQEQRVYPQGQPARGQDQHPLPSAQRSYNPMQPTYEHEMDAQHGYNFFPTEPLPNEQARLPGGV